MKHLQYRWKSRLSFALFVSIVLSILMVTLELTPWAEQINHEGYSHGDEEEPSIPSVMIYILPFVKEIVLIGVPMLLTLVWVTLVRTIKVDQSNK
ncbi:hypothetical protein [Marinomonas algicola]|uniref:hypothetical protein n=1 Tax=Marinomonas algicola TaxID=2773454 RepID=UPI00174CF5A2|nr:hypothetical protein [Marinomonas algicola]